MLACLVCVRKCMWVEFTQDEHRLASRILTLDEFGSAIRDIIVDRQHALLGERASVLADLLADPAEARIDSCVVRARGLAVQYAARAIFSAECRVILG